MTDLTAEQWERRFEILAQEMVIKVSELYALRERNAELESQLQQWSDLYESPEKSYDT